MTFVLTTGTYFKDNLSGVYGRCDDDRYNAWGNVYRFLRFPQYYYLYNPAYFLYGLWSTPGNNVYGTSDTMCYNTNQATILQYVTDECPVDEPRELNKIPGYDALTQQLEDGIDQVLLLTPETQIALNCWKTKVESLRVTFKVTSTYRTAAYQKHLYDYFAAKNKLDQLDIPSEIEACKDLKKRVNEHFSRHGIKSKLVAEGVDGKHVQREAFDLSLDTTIDPLKMKLNTYFSQPIAIPNHIADCNLVYPNPNRDPVHFELK